MRNQASFQCALPCKNLATGKQHALGGKLPGPGLHGSPPVHRPSATVQTTRLGAGVNGAPPVYRPSAAVQTTRLGAGVIGAPPVYRPSAVAQSKPLGAGMQSASTAHQPDTGSRTAAAVYHRKDPVAFQPPSVGVSQVCAAQRVLKRALCVTRAKAWGPNRFGHQLTPAFEKSARIAAQAKFANNAAIVAPQGFGWNRKEYYEVNVPDWNAVMQHASDNALPVFHKEEQIAVPLLTTGPGPAPAFFGLFTRGTFTHYIDQQCNPVLEPQSERGEGGAFHQIPNNARDIVDELINRFNVTRVSSAEAKKKLDHIVTYQNNSNRIDRQGPSRNSTHAKFAVQIGTATYAGIEMAADHDFPLEMVRQAFHQSIMDGTYRRIFFG
ncbi:MAG: hypothetical protein ACJ746_03585 [Bryobacteraceae bacterium]